MLTKMYDVFDEVIKKIKTAQNSQCKNQRTWRLLNLSNRNYSNGKQNEKRNSLKRRKEEKKENQSKIIHCFFKYFHRRNRRISLPEKIIL